jgi:ferredoxin
MAKFRVEHQKEICIGCGACAAIDPEDWIMDGDKSHLQGSQKEGAVEVKIIDESKYNQNKEAADACPVPCIFVKKIE